MSSSVLVLSGFLLSSLGNYVSIPLKRVVAPPLRTGLTARRMESYAALPAEDWRPIAKLDYAEYFAAVLQIGTPVPQRQSVIIDTGSAITFVACTGCPASKCSKHDDPNFVPARSETFRWEDCPSCLSGTKFTCQSSHQCKFNLHYYDGAGASGRIFSDLVDFGWDPLRLQMGCASDERGGVISDHADGMMGLAIDKKASVAFQLGGKLNHVQIAHCFKNNGKGTLIFGEWEKPKNMTWVYLNTAGNHYWKTKTVSIWVGDRKVTSEGRLEKNQFRGTVWDTGSPHMWMPRWAYTLTQKVFLDVMKKYKTTSKGNLKICFLVDRAEALKEFPLFRFEQPDNIWLELTPMQYLITKEIRAGVTAQCVDLINAGNDREGVAFGSTNMLNMLISYDYKRGKFGFMQHNCDCFLLPNADCIGGEGTKGGRDSPALWVPTRQPIKVPDHIPEEETSEKVTTLPPSSEIVKETTNRPTSNPIPIAHPSQHPTFKTSVVTPTSPPKVVTLTSPAETEQDYSIKGYKILKMTLSFSFGLCIGGSIIFIVSKCRSKQNYRPLQTSEPIPQFTNELEIQDMELFHLADEEDDAQGAIL